MRVLSSQTLTLLAIIVGHLGILCVATLFPDYRCGRGRFHGPMTYRRHCYSPHMPPTDTCSNIESLCSAFDDFHDCLLPQFQCLGDESCIPRSRLCDGIVNCDDGSDEWGCSSRRRQSVATTSSDSLTISTILRDNEEKTTSGIIPEAEENTSASSTTTSTIFADSETNTVLSSSTTTNTMIPDSESNTVLSSTTASTMLPDSETNKVLSSSTTPSTLLPETELKTSLSSTTTTSTILPDSESKTSLSTTATTSTILPDSESKTFLSSSTSTSTMFPESESNAALSSSETAKTMLPDAEANTPPASFVPDSTIVPDFEEKTSFLTTNILPGSSAMQSCPDNYCMQNAACIVFQGRYHCKCPSAFIGEHCEIELGTAQVSHEYAVAIAIFTALVILCISVVSMCIYRYKRVTAFKSNDMTSRTLSQLTLTANAIY